MLPYGKPHTGLRRFPPPPQNGSVVVPSVSGGHKTAADETLALTAVRAHPSRPCPATDTRNLSVGATRSGTRNSNHIARAGFFFSVGFFFFFLFNIPHRCFWSRCIFYYGYVSAARANIDVRRARVRLARQTILCHTYKTARPKYCRSFQNVVGYKRNNERPTFFPASSLRRRRCGYLTFKLVGIFNTE